MLTDRIFMKKANQYWNKEIKKMNKDRKKRKAIITFAFLISFHNLFNIV